MHVCVCIRVYVYVCICVCVCVRVWPAPPPVLPLYMFAGGGEGAREENLVLAADLLAITVLLGSKVQSLLGVLHLVGELVGPG